MKGRMNIKEKNSICKGSTVGRSMEGQSRWDASYKKPTCVELKSQQGG
jgi:hypothetical protein